LLGTTSSVFEKYSSPSSAADAAVELAGQGAVPMGGGTDLLVSLEEGFVSAAAVVDLRGVANGDRIEETTDGGLRIGGATRIQEIASHPLVRRNFACLAEACDAVGTPALREMGTIGGNLCQRPRCWYLRRGIACYKSGGNSCPAKDGENQYHAILDGGPCYIVHPSDPAVALTALEAEVEIRGRSGTRLAPIADFYVLPRERLDHETILQAGEFVSAVILPGASAGGVQRYTKLMQRGAWDFALVSCAATRRQNGDVRMVLGGVAPRPWRVPESLEEDIAAGGLDADTAATIAERALYDARPLSGNAYKVALAETLIRRSIAELLS
jgi:xanthine dehydrogenase YagS FAD-binding subunit